MSGAALVTIGITCFNAEASIEAAVNSALKQTYTNTEIVIVDDGSTDHSWSVLERLQASQPDKIRIFKNAKNSGVAATRNHIIREARGVYLAFFDDDDQSVPERVSEQVRRISEYRTKFKVTAPVICHAARAQVYPDGMKRIEQTMGIDETITAPHGADMAAHILFNKPLAGGHGSLATCSQMSELETYRALGGFDEKFWRSEDTEFNVRLARAGGHFVGIAKPLVRQTMTRSLDKNLLNERRFALALYEKHKDFLSAAGRGSFDRDWLSLKHDYLENRSSDFWKRFLRLFKDHPRLFCERLFRALPNLGYNRVFRKFHKT